MSPKSKKRWQKKLLWLGVFILLAYLLIGGEYNFYNLFKLKQQKATLSGKIKEAETERENLYQEIDKLQNDSSYIEKIAREEYIMGKKGEKVYIIQSKEDE